MQGKVFRKIIAIMLCFMMVFSFSPAQTLASTMAQESTQPTQASQTSPYTPENTHGNIQGDVYAKDAYSTTFRNDDGTYTAIMYAAPVRIKNDENRYMDIDTSFLALTEAQKAQRDTTYAYASTLTEAQTFLPAALSIDTPAVTQYGRYSVAMLPVTNASSNTLKTALTTQSNLSVQPLDAMQSAVQSQAVRENGAVQDLYGASHEKITALTYEAFNPAGSSRQSEEDSIEIQYIAENTGFKENIILHAYTGIHTFDFYMEIENAYAALTQYGAILLYDSDTNKEIGAIPIPFAYDGTGKIDYDAVHYDLTSIGQGRYLVTVEVDEGYLTDDARVYPVTIDPSVTYKGSASVYDVYVKSGYAGTNFYSSGTRVMPVGYGTEGYSRTYIKIPSVNNLSGKVITSAKFYFKENNTESPYATVQVRRVAKSWAVSSIKWNNQPSYTSASFGSRTLNGGSSYKNIDMTSLVAQWANGTYANYGFLLKASVEKTSVRNYCDLFGSRTGSASNRPYLAVTYYNPPTLQTPIVTQGAKNTRHSDITLQFSAVTGITAYQLKITNGSSTITRNITDEITADETGQYTWTSAGKTLFTNTDDPSLPDDATTVLGGEEPAYTISIGALNAASIPAYSNEKTVLLPDTTPPNTIPSDTFSASVAPDEENSGKTKITVSFSNTTDLPTHNQSGISKYTLRLYAANTYLEGTKTDIPYDPQTQTYTYVYRNLNAQNDVSVKVEACDNNLNTSAEVSTSTFNITDTQGPSAPVVSLSETGWTDETNITISWEGITDNIDPLTQLNVYYAVEQLNDGVYTEVKSQTGLGNASAGSCTQDFSALHAQGILRIGVWAVDSSGNIGTKGYAYYYKDTQHPTITITSPQDQESIDATLEIVGSIEDIAMSSWEIAYKKDTLFTSYTTLSSGSGSLTGTLLVFDSSGLEDNTNYTFKITAQDMAGNTTEKEVTYLHLQNGTYISPAFSIDKTLTDGKWTFGQYNPALTLSPSDAEALPEGDKTLFIDNAMYASFADDAPMTLDLSNPAQYPEKSEHLAVVRITDAQGNDYYSAPVIAAQKASYTFPTTQGVTLSEGILLLDSGAGINTAENYTSGIIELNEETITGSLASFTFDVEKTVPQGCNVTVYARVNGSTYFPITPGEKVYAETLAQNNIPNHTANNQIQIKLVLETTDPANTPVVHACSLDTVQFTQDEASKFLVELIDAPKNLTTQEKVNYTALLRWDASETDDVTYNVYRSPIVNGTTPDFSNMQLVQEGLTETYWYDSNMRYNETFVYCVTAVKEINQFERQSAPTDEYPTATVVAQNEVSKHLGLQSYWDYTSFSDTFGTGYLELSDGNFAYQTTDAQLSSGSLSLVMRRTYNAQSTSKSPLGYGWDFNFNTALLVEYNDADDPYAISAVLLKDGDGTIHRFLRLENGQYSAPKGVHMQLDYDESTNTFHITRNDGILYTFNQSNQIASMQNRAGEQISFFYDEQKGNLAYVTNQAGDRFSFTYNEDDLLTKMTLPDGHTIQYTYTNQNYLQQASQDVTQYQNGSASGSVEIKQHYTYSAGQLCTLSTPAGNGISANYQLLYDDEGRVSKLTYPNGETLQLTYAQESHINGNYTTQLTTKTAEDAPFSSMAVTFNPNGVSVLRTDSSGTEIAITRDSNYNITSTSFDNTFFSVNAQGDVRKSSRRIAYYYTYDDNQNITSVRLPNGETETYAYNDAHNPCSPTSVTTPKTDTHAITTSTTYDQNTGNMLTQTDPSGKQSTYTYGYTNEEGEQINAFLLYCETDRNGAVTSYTYDAKYRLTSTSIDLGEESIVNEITLYDAMARPTEAKDANGVYYTNVYDELGNIVKMTNLGKNKEDTSDDIVSTMQYYTSGLVSKTTDANGNYTTYTYDNMNRAVSAATNEQTDTVPMHTTTYTYGYEQLTIFEETFLAFTRTTTQQEGSTSVVEKKEYFDNQGNLRREEQNGTWANICYDEIGNILKIEYENGQEICYIYNTLMQNTDVIINPASDHVHLSYTYDYLGNVLTETNGEGNVKTYTYDDLSRLTSVQETQGERTLCTTYTYDIVSGDTIQNKVTNPRGLQSITTLDKAGRTLSEKEYAEEDGTVYAIETSYTYDNNGNVLTTTKNDGTTIWNTYDDRGNLTQSIYKKDEQGNALAYTLYTYDDMGNRLSMKDYEPDEEGSAQLQTQSGYAYDALYRTIQYNQDGEVVNYTYTPLGEVHTISYRNAASIGGEETQQVRICYNYNNDHLLTDITKQSLTGSGSVAEEKTLAQYTYNDAAQKTEQKVYRNFANSSTEYVLTTYAYNTLGLLEAIRYFDSTALTTSKESYRYMYDKRGFIIEEDIQNLYGEAPIDQTIAYTYDSIGRLTAVEQTDNTPDTPVTNQTQYTYDDAGNRTSMTKGSTTTTYTFNLLNQLVSSSEPSTINNRTNEHITHTYTYNANGDLIKEVCTEPLEDLHEELPLYPGYFASGVLTQTSTQNYSFDSAGRLTGADINVKVSGTVTKLKDEAGNTVQTLNQTLEPTTYKETQGRYTYNADGVRIKKDVDIRNGDNEITSSVERKYYYTGDAVLFAADAANNKTLENILTPTGDILLSSRFALDETNQNVSSGYYTFHTDIRGSTTSILQSDGTLCTGYIYDEFGNQIQTGDTDFFNETTYTGQIYDSETGLHYMNARYYNADTGQFISRDTYLGNAYVPWTQNLYTYTGNNPINYTDPTGHIPFLIVAAIIGLVIGSGVGAYTSYRETGQVQVKSVIKGGVIGTIVGLTSGALIAAASTGSIMASTSAVFTGISSILTSGSASTALSMIQANMKSAATEAANWVGRLFEPKDEFKGSQIDSYKNLRKVFKGMGKEVHHIIEKRFVDVLPKTKTNEILSIALDPARHRVFTNAWRQLIPYGSKTFSAEQVFNAAQIIYKDSPVLLDAVMRIFKLK